MCPYYEAFGWVNLRAKGMWVEVQMSIHLDEILEKMSSMFWSVI